MFQLNRTKQLIWRFQARQDRDYLMTIEDVMNHEKEHGRIPDGAAVFMYSGWDQFWFNHQT